MPQGRLLGAADCYVWKENGEFYNEKAVRFGYAKAVLYMPNDLYIDQIREAEAEAKVNKPGLWSQLSPDRARRTSVGEVSDQKSRP